MERGILVKFSKTMYATMSLTGLLLGSGIVTGCGTAASTGSTSSGNASSKSTNTTSGSASTTSSKPVTLTLYTSGDVNVKNLWEKDLIPQYKKKHPNVKFNVVYSAHGNNDQTTQDRIVAAEKANKDSGYDIVDGMVQKLAKANMLQKLSAQTVPNLAHIQPSLLKQNNDEGMPYRGSSVVLAYNSDHVKNPPTTLSGLISWIKSHPGKFTYNTPNTGGSGGNFVQGVINSKVPAKDQPKLVTESDKSLESTWKPGLKLLKSLGPDIYQHGFYPNGNTGTLNLLASGSIWVAPVWSDMALSALQTKQLPPSIKLIQLNPPFNGGPADLGVIKNSKHKKAADAFLNWVLSPSSQSIIIHQMNGYPGVEWKYVPKADRQKFASIAKAYATGWSSFYGADMNQAWQSQVASK